MTSKISAIIEELKTLTLSEAAQLVKGIEETFSVDTSQLNSSGVVVLPTENNKLQESSEIEEKTEFDVLLIDVPSAKKIAVLKIVRSITGLGLKEAKDLVESVPKLLKSGMSKNEAQDLKSKLEQEGAKIEIK